MSEPIPESIPTSADPRSRRPTKKRAVTPRAALANQVEALFAKPDRDIVVPPVGNKKTLPPPPEIVANVQGSSAGAGSGEFHVYKASRRREYDRLRVMDEEVKAEEAQDEFLRKKEEMERKDREKTEKNRKQREKARLRKGKKKNGGGGENGAPNAQQNGQVKKLAPNPGAAVDNKDEDGSRDFGADGTESNNNEEIGIVIHDED